MSSFKFSRFFVFVLLGIYTAGYGQAIYTEPNLSSIKSPNAANLGSFGDIPVSLYSGMPNIEIPIYNISLKGMSMPVSLQYYNTGFRPDQRPGWTGMNWVLNTGGAISRVVKDSFDEEAFVKLDGTVDPMYSHGLYFSGNITMKNLDWSQIIPEGGTANKKVIYDFINANDRFDYQADEFSFNFPGYSGKFYWDVDKNEWKVICDKPVKVVLDEKILLDVPFRTPSGTGYFPGGYKKTFAGFTIITENGVKYKFGGDASAIEYSVGLYSQLWEHWIADTWNLVSVKDPHGNEISLSYEPGQFICEMYEYGSYAASRLSFYQSCFLSRADFNCDMFDDKQLGYGDERGKYNGKLIRPVYLRGISTPNGQTSVHFNSVTSTQLRYDKENFDYYYYFSYPTWGNSGGTWQFLPFLQKEYEYPECLDNLVWRKLSDILILRDGSSPMRFVFNYNDDPNDRLRMISCGLVGAPLYKFEYNIGGRYGNLPKYCTSQTDHWGYYTGRNAAVWPSGYDESELQAYYDGKECTQDTLIAQLGTIKKITYPTGGISEFRFEQNTFSKQLDETRTTLLEAGANGMPAKAGGVRIKSIASYTTNMMNSMTKKMYDYTDNSLLNRGSSGILGGMTKYHYRRYYHEDLKDLNCYQYKVNMAAFSTSSVLPSCSNVGSSHVGYSEVTEKRSDGSAMIHKFSNFGPGFFDEQPIVTVGTLASLQQYSSHEQLRGKLIQEKSINANGQTVHEKTIQYSRVYEGSGFLRNVKRVGYYPCPSQVGKEYKIGYFAYNKIYTYSYLPTSEVNKLYDNYGKLVKSDAITLEYNSNKMVDRKLEINNNNGGVYTMYSYPYKVTLDENVSRSSEGFALNRLVDMNIISKPINLIETEYLTNKVRRSAFQTYKIINESTGIPEEYKTYETEITDPFVMRDSNYPQNNYVYPTFNSDGSVNTDSRLKLVLEARAYDNYGNILNRWKPGNLVDSYQWAYDGLLPIAKITNAASDQVIYQNFENGTSWGSKMTVTYGGARTGARSAQFVNTGTGIVAEFCPQTIKFPATTVAKKYLVTCWVKSNGPNTQLTVYLKKQGATDVLTGSFIEVIQNIGSTQGNWVLMQKEIVVPAGVVEIVVRPGIDRLAGVIGTAGWIDDIRVHAADVQVETFTHQVGVGITSSSDVNNHPRIFEYDGLSRLKLIKDWLGNVIKQMDYHYQQ